jgi:predicted Zn-dependent protease
MKHVLLALSIAATVAACATATSPTGRTQRVGAVSQQQLDQMGAQAFAEYKAKLPQSRDARQTAYVRCVVDAVTRELPNEWQTQWESAVFVNESPNAFALPGGKVGMYTGIFSVARNQDQLAAVIGHEVAHVLAGHSNERASTQLATQGAMEALSVLSGPASPGKSQVLAVLGVGAQVGVILPFSRAQESEADVLGLDLMARAGFDPNAGPALWENMAKLGGSPPELLSTHPSSATRIAALRERVKIALPIQAKARAAGRQPSCG